MSVAFDTLNLADKLQSAGFTAEQFRGPRPPYRTYSTPSWRQRADMASEHAALRLEFRALLAEAKTDMVKWLVESLVVQFAALVGVIEFFQTGCGHVEVPVSLFLPVPIEQVALVDPAIDTFPSCALTNPRSMVPRSRG